MVHGAHASMAACVRGARILNAVSTHSCGPLDTQNVHLQATLLTLDEPMLQMRLSTVR